MRNRRQERYDKIWAAYYANPGCGHFPCTPEKHLLEALEAIRDAHDRDGYETRQFALDVELILANGGRKAIAMARGEPTLK